MALLTAYMIGSPGQKVGVDLKSWTSADLSGNAPFKIEDTVSSGYVDVSSLENWDKFGQIADRDYLVVLKEIRNIIAASSPGYATLSDADKKIALKHFSSEIGAEYNNALWTDAEQDAFNDVFRLQSRDAREERDSALSRMMFRKIFQGILTRQQLNDMVYDSSTYRLNYTRDGLEGTAYGDNRAGLMDWIGNTDIFTHLSITSVDTGNKKFTITGKNRPKFRDTDYFCIRNSGSPNNDGTYTIVNVILSGGNTIVEVNEAIPSASTTGEVYWGGLYKHEVTDADMRSNVLDIYKNGIY